MRPQYYELRQQHLGWVHNPNVSNGQLADSKTILNLIDELERVDARAAALEAALQGWSELEDLVDHWRKRALFAEQFIPAVKGGEVKP